MAKMKAVQIGKAGGDFELVEREIPAPGPDQVLLKVEACGVCHSDMFTKEGLYPGIEFPRVPGHEVVGRIKKVGKNVKAWKVGQRVGSGWHGGHCFVCDPCRHGDFINCENMSINGVTHDGGYAEYMVANQEALALIPASVSSMDAAPLLCAGITTYNALRNADARPGDLVAILGIGGLGHLAVQFAHKMGFRTIAISQGKEKEGLSLKLGADTYIDASEEDPAEALAELGGAKVILATAPSSKAITGVIDGLAENGVLLVEGNDKDPIQVVPRQLIAGRRSIKGWASGHAADSEDTLNFSALTEIRPLIETFSLERAAEAYEKMMSNEVRFRSVLVMGE